MIRPTLGLLMSVTALIKEADSLAGIGFMIDMTYPKKTSPGKTIFL